MSLPGTSIIPCVSHQRRALQGGLPEQRGSPSKAGCHLVGRIDGHQVVTQCFTDF